jgi:integrase
LIVVPKLSDAAGTTTPFTLIIGGWEARMHAKKPLTDRAIHALKPAPKGKRKLVWDALVPGLAVRVTDTGQRSFVLVTRYPGSQHPTPRALGTVGAISLEDARAKAREWHKSIAAGIDPAQTAQRAERDTLRSISEEYLAREGGKLRSADYRKSVLERLVYPALGSVPIIAIRRSDIVRLLDRIEDDHGPHMANTVLAFLRRIMSWHAARADDFQPPIVRGMSRDKGQARERVLTDDEIRAIWKATSDDGVVGAYIRFLLLTGARRNEAAKMEWAEISEGDWTLPAARNKTGVDLTRPLSRAAQAILTSIPRNGPWVFTRSGTAGLGGFTKLKAELDRASGTSGWTLHDLRRTSRSLMSRAGVPSDHAERCLGHLITGIRSVYDRHQYREEMLLAYEKLSALISGIVDPQPNIVAIRR